MRADQEREDAGGCRIGKVAARQPPVQIDHAAWVAGQLERERVGTGLDRPREPVAGDARREGDQAGGERERRQVAGLAGLDALGPRNRGGGAGRGDQRERRGGGDEDEPTEDVPPVHVRELVRDHRAPLGSLQVVDQGVVEDDPLRGADAVDVRVDRVRAAAGVHPIDLPHVHAGLPRELQHVVPRLSLGQRLEPVEERRENHGREPGQQGAAGGDRDGPRSPPAQPEAAHQGEGGASGQAGEGRADGRGLGPVPEPAAERLCGEARPDRPSVGRDAEWDRHERQGAGEACRGKRPAGCRPRPKSLEGPPRGGRPAGGEQRQERPLGGEASDQDQPLPGGVFPRRLQVGLGEVLALVDANGALDAARAEQPGRRLRHGRRGSRRSAEAQPPGR